MQRDVLAQIKQFFFNLVPTLDEEKWKLFANLTIVREYKKGEILLKPGQVCNYISFINYGLIREYFLVDGKEVIYAFFPENDYYAEYESFLSRSPSKRYAETLEDTEVVDLDYESLQLLYEKYPECERAGRLVAEELFVLLSNRSSSFLLQTPEERYKQFVKDCPAVVNRVPQYMIASYLGITPEALSRIRARMSRKTAELDLNQ